MNLKKRLYYFFIKGNRFEKEFKREVRMLIVITLGFTIAFTWRQTIFDLSQALIQLITHIQNSSALSIFTSIFITVMSILLIYISSHFLKDQY